MMRICNGRKGLDRDIGDFTYIGTNGSSVIDYVLCSDTMLNFIDNFKIEHRTESSHFPVSMSVQCMFRLSDHTAKLTLNYDRQFYKFDGVTTTKYKENLNHLLTNEIIHNFILTIQDYSLPISTEAEQFLDIFYKCGSCCIKICKGSVRLQPRWFDITCKRLKHEKYLALRQYRRQHTPASLSLYKEARKTFKAHCDRQKSIYNASMLDDQVASSFCPKSFWNKLKNITGSRKQSNNITKEQWKTHFETLFSNHEQNEGNEDNELTNDSVIDIEYDITEDELENTIFNSEIKDVEIIKAFQALKKGKSGGQDELITEFFIYSIEHILPIINCLFNRIFNSGDFPPSWGHSILVTLFKKGDINDPNNYRGISLLDVIGKIYTSVITRRITFFTNIYDKISESQARRLQHCRQCLCAIFINQ